MVAIILMSVMMASFTGAGQIDDENGSRASTPSRSIPVNESSWPMYLGDHTHQGYSASEIPMENTTDILWGQRVDGLMGTASPIVHDGVVYIGSGNGHMRGFDIDTGEIVWDIHIGNHRIRAAATVDNGTIYFGADNGHLYGFRISDKVKTLDVNLKGSEIESSPLIVEERIFIGVVGSFLKNHRFHAVDIDTGEINWTLSMGDLENYYGYKETASYWNGRIYIGDGNGTIFCLDKDGFWDGNDGPHISEDNTSMTSPDIIWKVDGPFALSTDTMIAEGNVYYGNVVGRFFCRDALTGDSIWNKSLGKGERSIQSSATYKDGRVYLTARNTVGVFEGASVFSLDSATGGQIWRFNISGQIITESAPIIIDGGLVFGSRNHKVYFISTVEENIADEDRIFWKVSTGSPITSTPAVAKGRVFISNEPLGTYGKIFAIGAPDPSIDTVWISDPAPYIGEAVLLGADILNNATVDCWIDVEFKVSTLNFTKQVIVGTLEDVYIEAGKKTSIHIDWTVEGGFDFFAALLTGSTPKDRNVKNNVGASDLFLKTPLSGYWTSSGSGPGMSGGSGNRLESNRSFWEMDLGEQWKGSEEDPWYNSFGGNGTISSTGAALYLTDPYGDLLALNTSLESNGVPGLLWKYSNSSVDLMGRPIALVDQERSFGGPNRIYSYGDDGAMWAFDWVGFWDGINDGPFLDETGTSNSDGDVIWRSEIPSEPVKPLIISGGNIIVTSRDGRIRGLDDDTGSILWTYDLPYSPNLQISSDERSLFVIYHKTVNVLDPNTGITRYTMDLEGIPDPSVINSSSITDEGLLITTHNYTALFDLDPSDGVDEGILDNSTSSDLIWSVLIKNGISCPPAISPDEPTIGICSGDRIYFHYLNNGTEISNISIDGIQTGRLVSGGDSYYIVAGSSPWDVIAYSPTEVGIFETTWSLDLPSRPRGELVIVGNHMYITMGNGRIMAIGAENNDPVAIISSPYDGILLFPGEDFTLDASGSYDLDDDPLTYVWFLEGEDTPVYEGINPVQTLSLQGIGKKKLKLRVYDDMRAYGESVINVTILKRVTSPDFKDYLYDIEVHMSYGISEASGIGLVNTTVGGEVPDASGALFICHLDFIPWPTYASYRFEWANVSIGYKDKEFKVKANEEKLGLFYYNELTSTWEGAGVSGVMLNDSKVFGNFSSLRSGFYAIGILDNSLPELRHRDAENYRYKMIDSNNYKFRVEYRDVDNDIPVSIRLVIDNRTEYDLVDEGFATSVLRWAFFSVTDVDLLPGDHSYYFEVDDGNFIVTSDHFHYTASNTPPVVNIIGPTSVVYTGDIILFDGSSSYDPDGNEISFSWDFNNNDGIQKDKVDRKVDHIYYDEGNYIITLTVSDGVDKTSKTLSITVIDNGNDDTDPIPISTGLWILILSVIGILILAIVIFIVVSKKGHEEQTDIQRSFEGRWACPECGTRVPNGVEECPRCDYLYDPMDFDEMDEIEGEDDNEM